MRTLIIHPDDRSTDFLRPIYQNIKGATVLTKDTSRKQLEKAIYSHDQILMMGHGSPYGLLNYSRIGEGIYAVGEKQVPLLRDKQCIFIWCNADQFVSRHQLKGLYTGMFISEVSEAKYCKVPADQGTVDASNFWFADLLGGVLTEEPANYNQIFEHVKTSYGELAVLNEVADYNNQRWYFEPKDSAVTPSTLCSRFKSTIQKLFLLGTMALSLSACSPYVYEVTYYQGIENTGVIATSDFVHVSRKDTACWDWYKETPVFEELGPKSDSITISYWGTRKEWRALNR
jgi:hypothetical protein